MPIIDSSHPLAELLQKDQRYPLEAYIFILESLSFAQDSLGMGVEPPEDDVKTGGEKGSPGSSGGHSKLDHRRRPERHLTGQELCEAARQYALQQYGFLACTVLATWGLRSTNDFGELVFNMIDIGQMRKTRNDKREDFHGVYDFQEAFSRDLEFVAPDTK